MKNLIITTEPIWVEYKFTATQGKVSASVELYLNRKTKKFRIESPSEESVVFRNNLLVAQLTAKAVDQALEMVDNYLHPNMALDSDCL